MGRRDTWVDGSKMKRQAHERPWQLKPGDGAFYGPKIGTPWMSYLNSLSSLTAERWTSQTLPMTSSADITVVDALKRRHQCATIQVLQELDMSRSLLAPSLTFSCRRGSTSPMLLKIQSMADSPVL
eukprot:753428-Hanusia_phi.AAC.4